MFRIEIHLPIIQIDGNRFSEDISSQFEENILKYSTGFYKFRVHGAWKKDNTVIYNEHMCYHIDFIDPSQGESCLKFLNIYIKEIYPLEEKIYIHYYELTDPYIYQYRINNLYTATTDNKISINNKWGTESHTNIYDDYYTSYKDKS